jgi:hypothetical protein
MLRILSMLDERADTIGARLRQIEIRMGELWGEDKQGKKTLAGITLAKIQRGPSPAAGVKYECKLGWVILMMGILGIFVPADGMEVREKRLAYEGIQ